MTSRFNSTTYTVITLIIAAFFINVPNALALEFGSNPFERGGALLQDWGQQLATVVTFGAFLGLVAVILAAMFNKLMIGWAVKIVGGLIALTGVSWGIAAATGG